MLRALTIHLHSMAFRKEPNPFTSLLQPVMKPCLPCSTLTPRTIAPWWLAMAMSLVWFDASANDSHNEVLFVSIADDHRVLRASHIEAEFDLNPALFEDLRRLEHGSIHVLFPAESFGDMVEVSLKAVPSAAPEMLVTLMSPSGLVEAFSYTPDLNVFRLADGPWEGFLLVHEHGIRGVLTARGQTIEISPVSRTRHTWINVDASPGQAVPSCGLADDGAMAPLPSPQGTGSGARSDTLCVEFAIDIDHYTYNTLNQNIDSCIVWGVGHLAGASEIYIQELNGAVEFRPIHCNIWVEPEPWADVVGDASDMLNQMTQEWNNNPILSTISRDLVHLFSRRWDTGVGGIAWLGATCGFHGAAFSNSLGPSVPDIPNLTWGLKTICHEIGHNFGARHTHWCNWPGGPNHPNGSAGGTIHNCALADGGCINVVQQESGTIMSYCFAGPLEFHPVVQEHALYPGIATASCLGDCGEFPDPLNLLGCTDDGSCNFEPSAMINDGSCEYPAFDYVDCNGDCLFDDDNDGICDAVDECVGPCQIPNVFTPNASRGNNVFPVRDLEGFDGSVLHVYNRVGNLVWNGVLLPGQDRLVWDGNRHNGQPCSEGVYFWVLHRSDGVKKSGEVQLFRGA